MERKRFTLQIPVSDRLEERSPHTFFSVSHTLKWSRSGIYYKENRKKAQGEESKTYSIMKSERKKAKYKKKKMFKKMRVFSSSSLEKVIYKYSSSTHYGFRRRLISDIV